MKMVCTTCDNCGGSFHWTWTEAFDKFGFKDGDGQIETYQVVNMLTEAGYDVDMDKWGMHNVIILSIKFGDQTLMSCDSPNYVVGYDNPRDYLPEKIIKLLDEAFPE